MDEEKYKKSLKEKIAAQEFACKQLRSHRRIGDVSSSDLLVRAEQSLADFKTILARLEAKSARKHAS